MTTYYRKSRRLSITYAAVNNLPETRFEDIKRVLRVAKQRVAARQKQAER